MNKRDLVELANNLSNQNICDLIDMLAPRIDVYIGISSGVCITSSISHSVLNGTLVQINLETSELEDLDWGYE